MNNTKTKFNILLEEAKNDPNILSFWVGGSQGKGMTTEHSDYDCAVIVKDDAIDEYKKKYTKLKNTDFEFSVMTLEEFRDHAEWGTEYEYDRYNFCHIKPLVDKTGEIEELFAKKSVIPKDKVRDFVSGNIDAYINQVYRSLKCFRDANPIGAHLEAADSIPCLFNVLFGLEGRLKPYYKYIQWELKKYPLIKLPWSPDILLEKAISVLKTADISTQQDILKTIEPILRNEGYGNVIDGWNKEKLDWMKSYSK